MNEQREMVNKIALKGHNGSVITQSVDDPFVESDHHPGTSHQTVVQNSRDKRQLVWLCHVVRTAANPHESRVMKANDKSICRGRPPDHYLSSSFAYLNCCCCYPYKLSSEPISCLSGSEFDCRGDWSAITEPLVIKLRVKGRESN